MAIAVAVLLAVKKSVDVLILAERLASLLKLKKMALNLSDVLLESEFEVESLVFLWKS